MNLEELKNLGQAVEVQTLYRHQQAERCLTAGLSLIEAAQNNNFENPDQLKEAVPMLMDALRYRRRDARCHLALAYVYLLTDMEDLAGWFARKAAELAPGEQMVSDLLWLFEDELEETHIDNFIPADRALKQTEAQEIFVRLENHIVARVLRLTRHPQYLLEADTSLERAQAFQTAIGEIQAMYEEIKQRLQHLAPHLAVEPLYQRLQPLKAHLRQMQHKYALCCELRLMQKQLEVSQKACQDLNQTFSRHLTAQTLQAEIDVLLDDCDGFARRIEEVEAEDGEIDDLTGLYHVLIDQVTALMERHALEMIDRQSFKKARSL